MPPPVLPKKPSKKEAAASSPQKVRPVVSGPDPFDWPDVDLFPELPELPTPLGFELRIDTETAPNRSPMGVFSPRTQGRPKRDRSKSGWIPSAPRANAPVEDSSNDEAKKQQEEEQGQRSVASRAVQMLRGAFTANDLGALKFLAEDPRLALTVAQQDIVNLIGRYASVGDKAGIRRALMNLAERVDVSSPHDGAVLVAQDGDGSDRTSGPDTLPDGKRSLDQTQGGRVMSALQTVLAGRQAFSWKDGLDRGFGRLTERFGQEATGGVDVVVASRPASAPAEAIGSWSGPGGEPAAPAVGQWSKPSADVPQAADSKPGSGEAAPARRVGQWGPAADPSSASGDGPAVGQWSEPGAAGASADEPPPVGKWTTAEAASTGTGVKEPPVGRWGAAAPAAPDAPDSPARVGSWGPAESSSPREAGVGEWTTAESAGQVGAEPKVGQWATAPAAGGETSAEAATPGRWSATSGKTVEPVGQWKGTSSAQTLARWQREGDVVLADGVNLSDILRKNPKLSDVRLVELVSGVDGQQSPVISTVSKVARSVLAQRFGFR